MNLEGGGVLLSGTVQNRGGKEGPAPRINPFPPSMMVDPDKRKIPQDGGIRRNSLDGGV